MILCTNGGDGLSRSGEQERRRHIFRVLYSKVFVTTTLVRECISEGCAPSKRSKNSILLYYIIISFNGVLRIASFFIIFIVRTTKKSINERICERIIL